MTSTLKRRGFFVLLEHQNYPTPRSMYSVLLATVMSICLKLNLTGLVILDLDRPCATFATDRALCIV